LGTNDTHVAHIVPKSAISGWTDAELRQSNIEFTVGFLSQNATSLTFSWKTLYIVVDYALPVAGNTLFFGENF
jgi:hypothetical protein